MAADGKIPLPVDYVFLKVLQEKAASDPHRYAVLAAFEGLAIIAECWRGRGIYKGPVPPDNAMQLVPRWIFDTLGEGWLQHRTEAPAGQTLGETFHIEGGGAGRQPGIRKWNRYLRNLGLARQVFEARQNTTYEEAVASVAQQHDLSDRTVKRAWSDHGPAIEKAAASYDKTS
ncbi:MAG: hypothetical protein O7B98_13580 [Alphaproteobacteria bacterium]|nr:hypothetical protein [Alphaproteobacteria bacterium]